MNQQQAFIAAVCADPKDDLPRLVYADWLDENGQPERAEFIRVQCELARLEAVLGSPQFWAALGAQHADCSGCSDWCRLRRREHDLFVSHPHVGTLTGPTGALPEGVACLVGSWTLPGHYVPEKVAIVRRGFVDEAHLTSSLWFGGGGCGRCGGTGRREEYPGEVRVGPNTPLVCPACSGTGRTPGLGRTLVRDHPLTAVTLTDKEPVHSRPLGEAESWVWYDGTADDRANLPADVYALMGGVHLEGTRFPTRESALAALSTALLRHAKTPGRRCCPTTTASDRPVNPTAAFTAAAWWGSHTTRPADG